MTARSASLPALILPFLVACSAVGDVRTDPLELCWAEDPGSRLRPPATIVFDEGGSRRLILCVEGGVYSCAESGAGRVEKIRSSARDVAAIAPAGVNQGFWFVEAASAVSASDRLLFSDLVAEPQVLYEAEGRTLGVPVRVGTREAWLASTSKDGAERAEIVTADLQSRRAVQWRPADLDAVYHIARNPHTGRTLVSGARRTGSRVEAGLFELQGGQRPVAELIDANAWSPVWSGCGKHFAVTRGMRSSQASHLRYGPLENCVLSVTSTSGHAHEIAVDGVVLALCFDPTDEDLLFVAVAASEEVELGKLSAIRILRVRIARDGLQSAAIAVFRLTQPHENGPQGRRSRN